MTSDDFSIDEDNGDEPGAYLRISRDATPDDLAAFLPDKTDDERAATLAKWRDGEGASVTLAVVVEVPASTIHAFGEQVPVREVTGLIIGPPGSERYLRRPDDEPMRYGVTVQETQHRIDEQGRTYPDGAGHPANPVGGEHGETTCAVCAGLLRLSDGGYAHSDDDDTAECIRLADESSR